MKVGWTVCNSKRNVKVRLAESLGRTEIVNADFSRFRFPVHFHDTFVIQLIRSGVDWCSGNGLAAQRGELCVHFPFSVHTGGTANGIELSYVAAYPTTDLVARLLGVDSDELDHKGTFVSDDRKLIREANRLFFFNEKSVDDSAKVKAFKNLLEMIIEKNQVKKRVESGATLTRMYEIRAFLKRHYANDLTNRELSERFLLSEYHLIRSFKKCFLITPRQFLISERILKAKELILNGESVVDAAFATGFADQSHLTRHFKRITGYRPGAIKVRA